MVHALTACVAHTPVNGQRARKKFGFGHRRSLLNNAQRP
jgi:hypothetical protein